MIALPLSRPEPFALDLDLARKYSVAGPRYTSYPTALHFRDEVSREVLEAELATGAASRQPLSLYFHLPFCESKCWFCGCTTVITKQRGAADIYLDHLEKEIALTAPRLGPGRLVTQMHFGGGTPTFLSPEQIRRLGRAIHAAFEFAPDAEVSVEIDPRRINREHLEAFREIGCNRASLGAQDHNLQVQQAVNRIQPFEVTQQAFTWLRECGFTSINLDLIYGLPYQTPESFAKTLSDSLTLEPDRLAIFSYAHVPWAKPAQKLLERDQALPGAETKLQMLKLMTTQLSAAGYHCIGMDHFARSDDELAEAQRAGTLQRNFQGYSCRAGVEIVGFGMSSISQTESSYRQNEKTLPAYYAAINAGQLPIARGCLLSPEDRLRRAAIMRLMCDLRLDFDDLSSRLGVDFATTFARELASLADLEADGLVERDAAGLTVTPLGRLLVRNIAMRFDAYLATDNGGYSKTV
jgi:oxygen-independent coproporphyrinogen III oxidase